MHTPQSASTDPVDSHIKMKYINVYITITNSEIFFKEPSGPQWYFQVQIYSSLNTWLENSELFKHKSSDITVSN